MLPGSALGAGGRVGAVEEGCPGVTGDVHLCRVGKADVGCRYGPGPYPVDLHVKARDSVRRAGSRRAARREEGGLTEAALKIHWTGWTAGY